VAGQRTRRLRWVALIGSTLFSLVLLEVALRIHARQGPLSPETAEAIRTKSIWRASADSELIYVHREGYVRDGQRVTEEHGILRAQDVSKVKSPGILRIVVLGDSLSAGLGIRPDPPFPAVLEGLARAQHPDLEVLNFGVDGYGTLQEARLYETHAASFDPDIVLLQFCLNDAAFSYAPAMCFLERPPSSYVLSNLIKLLDGADAKSRPPFATGRGPEGPQMERYWRSMYSTGSPGRREITRGFAKLRVATRRRDIPVVVVLFPLLMEPNSVEREIRELIRGQAKRSGFSFLDLSAAFRTRSVAELQDNVGEVVHPSPLGHRLAAQAIHDHLRTERLLR
jgi:lysophospholipase L1-like esterase